MNKFEEIGLKNQLLETVNKLGFTRPTKIQEESIPPILEGKDVIGESATGSGKTLAFGCGIIDKVIPRKGIQSLILTPTRELAEQVKEELKKLSNDKLYVTAVYGGVSINPQMQHLTRADVVVATPGRLLDHIHRGTIDISKVKVLVLDEADRMLDMGFIDDVEKIIQGCPNRSQTLFFSATMPPRIDRLAKKHMRNPVRVSAKRHVDPSLLKQTYYDVTKDMKMSLLAHLLKNEKSGLIMIFCNTRKTTDFVVKNLRANGIDATSIHGGLSQDKRTKTIQMFNDAKVVILVCTDVAARGLHIENVSHIYNYEMPQDPKDYVHRIGRTARAGESGKVVNLVCNYDYDNFARILDKYSKFYVKKMERPQFKKIFVSRPTERYSRGPQRRSYGSRPGRPQRGSGGSHSRPSGRPRSSTGRPHRSSRGPQRGSGGHTRGPSRGTSRGPRRPRDKK